MPLPCSLIYMLHLVDEPTYPKSMYLLQPLRISFELNYVAPHAQTAVAVPDGLDLDRWIVPPKVQARGEETEGAVKRSKKGKEKGVGGSGKKTKKKKGDAEAAVETPEEKAAREQVCV